MTNDDLNLPVTFSKNMRVSLDFLKDLESILNFLTNNKEDSAQISTIRISYLEQDENGNDQFLLKKLNSD